MFSQTSELVEEFLKDYLERGGRPRGAQSLSGCLPAFLSWVGGGHYELADLRYSQAMAYQQHLGSLTTRFGRPMARSSINAYLRACRALYSFLVRRGYVATNPFDLVKDLRTPRHVRSLPKEEELGRLLADLEHFDRAPGLRARKLHYRMHVIVELMYASGLRIDEVANLKVEDVDLLRAQVQVVDGKGGKNRLAFLSEYTRDVLRLYLEMRPFVFNELNLRNSERVFGMDRSALMIQLNRELAATCERLKIPRMTNHAFRHAMGYHLLRAGCALRHIQDLLGHKHLKQTELYTKVDKESLTAVVDEFHPRSESHGVKRESAAETVRRLA